VKEYLSDFVYNEAGVVAVSFEVECGEIETAV
jgi:hypothetical protein